MYKNKVFPLLLFSGLLFLLILIMQPLEIAFLEDYIPVLFPEGMIGKEQIRLLWIIQGLMLIIIIPVFVLTFIFSWKYRAGNKNEKYDPHLVDHLGAEVIWWTLPLIMVGILSILTWVKTHELDPYRPIPSENKPLTIQVVATQWNWLFIYPEQLIASLNFLEIPKDVPIHFEITSDAPMNSFWIPELGGQIYAMPKMMTELYLIANKVGEFTGRSANISGKGFAGMHFVTRSALPDSFESWVKEAKESKNPLDYEVYTELAKPQEDTPPKLFTLEDPDLFHRILMKYMVM